MNQLPPNAFPVRGHDPAAWSSWHLHLSSYAQSVYDRVVRDVIRPTVADNPDCAWFFLRYLRGGPHLRLRFHRLPSAAIAVTEERLRERLATAGVLRGDEEMVSEAAHRRQTTLQARTDTVGVAPEASGGPLPAGVYRTAYVPEYTRYGGYRLMSLSERLFTVSSALVLDYLRRTRDRQERMAMALRASACAALTLADRDEAAALFVRDSAVWRRWLVSYGHQEAEVQRWAHAARSAALAEPQARALLAAPHSGPLTSWHAACSESVAAWRQVPDVAAVRVLSSHLHMLYNRLGLGPVDEMRVHSALAACFQEVSVRGTHP